MEYIIHKDIDEMGLKFALKNEQSIDFNDSDYKF